MKLPQLLICFLLAGASGFAAVTNDLPQFDQVYQLLRTNLGGTSAAELDRAAVKGIIQQLAPRVALSKTPEAGSAEEGALSKTNIYDSSYLYFRVSQITPDLAQKLMATYQVSATNKPKIKGILLDLRFTQGTDYAAAARVADLFFRTAHPLVDWGTGSASSTQKDEAITLPVAVLINSETLGAAEALAAMLRQGNVGLLIGSNTAGQASVFKEFPLADGAKLRIATVPVKVGDKVLAKIGRAHV